MTVVIESLFEQADAYSRGGINTLAGGKFHRDTGEKQKVNARTVARLRTHLTGVLGASLERAATEAQRRKAARGRREKNGGGSRRGRSRRAC